MLIKSEGHVPDCWKQDSRAKRYPPSRNHANSRSTSDCTSWSSRYIINQFEKTRSQLKLHMDIHLFSNFTILLNTHIVSTGLDCKSKAVGLSTDSFFVLCLNFKRSGQVVANTGSVLGQDVLNMVTCRIETVLNPGTTKVTLQLHC